MVRHMLSALKVLICRVADPDPHYFWKLDTDPHYSEKLNPDPLLRLKRAVEGCGRSQWRPGGSKTELWMMPVVADIQHSMRRRIRIRIRIKEKSWIRIRIKVKSWSRV
jgi:hypothetical protein